MTIKKNKELDQVSGDLMKEIDDNQVDAVSGGTNDYISKKLAANMGLGSNYGSNCTLSAECATTIACG